VTVPRKTHLMQINFLHFGCLWKVTIQVYQIKQ